MRFYWVCDRVGQGHFRVHWKPGADNYANYYTKHFSPSHHQQMRPVYLHPAANEALDTPVTNRSLSEGVLKYADPGSDYA
jgi:hypothetical protein